MLHFRNASIAASLGLILSLCACHNLDEPAESLQVAAYELPEGSVRFSDALAELDQRLAAGRERADAEPDSWMPRASLAGLYLQRARLSGQLDDYLQAERVLDEAFAIAPTGSGPWLVRAQLEATLHRLTAADSALDQAESAVLVDEGTRAAIFGLRGDISMLRGDMNSAREQLELAESLDPTSSSAARLALWQWRSGDFENADALYDLAATRYHGASAETRAWFELQRGILDLDQGRYDEALAHYLDANATLSGYYLIEEHIAEILVLQGKAGEAYGLYLAIVDETQAPEFMDALAGLFIEAGDDAVAQSWIASARERYEADIALLPEAATGHALGHYLAFGPPQRAVELAQANHALRPNPASAGDLALAFAAQGDGAQAKAWADAVMDGAWRGYDVFEAAARGYEAAGELQHAQAALAQACSLAPARCD